MGIYNRKQAFADELIRRLGDKKRKAFGLYVKLIEEYGESQMRVLLSEILDEYRRGKIDAEERVKLFIYRLTKRGKQQRS